MATSRNLFEKNQYGIYERVGTTLPEGYEKLGPEYNQQPKETAEQAKARQLVAYQNIQPVGKIGMPGSYLMGKKIRQPTRTNPPIEEKPTAIAPEQADIFNSLLKDILVKRQGIDLSGLRKAQREAQLKNISQQQAPIGESMKGLSPEQIGSIRQAQAKTMEPELLKAKADLEKAQEQATNFETMYSKAAELGQEFIKNMVAPDSVVQSYKHWIEARPGDFKEILSSNKINDKTKEAIFKVLDWSVIKEAEKETGEQFTLNPGDIRYDAQGNVVAKGANKITSSGGGGGGGGGGTTNTYFSDAEQIIAKFPDASYEDLDFTIKNNLPKISDSDVKIILNRAGKKPAETIKKEQEAEAIIDVSGYNEKQLRWFLNKYIDSTTNEIDPDLMKVDIDEKQYQAIIRRMQELDMLDKKDENTKSWLNGMKDFFTAPGKLYGELTK